MEKKLILAPLQGFTDAAFRQVYPRHFTGFDEAMAPFISTMGEKRLKPSRIKDVLPENNPILPVVPQILGNVAEDFIFLTHHLADMGYTRVNWNLGCPHSKIAKKRRGSGLLCWPDHIDSFLEQVVGAIPCSLSVKVRLGRNRDDEIYDLLPVFDRYPLEEIIVHPRTGVQLYTGQADIDAFGRIAEKTRHSLVYNGDITEAEGFHRIAARFPMVDRFMIGRGVLADPFLPAAIKGEVRDRSEDLARIKRFHDDLFETYDSNFYGPSHIAGRMKGFWNYLAPSFKGGKKALKRIFKSKNREEYLIQARLFFSEEIPFSPGDANTAQ
ncbi:MAG: tRNA-dihydrouridine synthase family protein [Desulfobacteraceae bacterium]|nr:tRNA-dihydrouridine synthase family protein [Desulfobacteraceae bacterium]